MQIKEKIGSDCYLCVLPVFFKLYFFWLFLIGNCQNICTLAFEILISSCFCFFFRFTIYKYIFSGFSFIFVLDSSRACDQSFEFTFMWKCFSHVFLWLVSLFERGLSKKDEENDWRSYRRSCDRSSKWEEPSRASRASAESGKRRGKLV